MKSLKFFLQFSLLAGLLLTVTDVYSQDPNLHIYLCFGQSNMVGGGQIEPQDQTVDSRFQTFQAVDCSNLGRYKGNLYPATPPLCRCYHGLGPIDYFGRTMVENLPSNVRVAVIVVAVEGCQIELFDKDEFQNNLIGAPDWLLNIVNYDYGGNPYQYLIDLATSAKNEGVIKGILLHQGESNYGDSQWPTKVKTVYDDMMIDLGLNPASVPLLAGQLAGGDASGMNSQIISTLPQVIPNAHIVSSNGCEVGEDGIHFTSVGYRELGRHYASVMLSLLGNNCTPTSITPYVQIDNGSWQQTSSVTVDAGAQVKFGPQPVSGGSWSWSGCGTSGSSREQTVYPTSPCTATATYTNSCGATSTQNFNVSVNGGSSGGTFNGVYSFIAQHSGKAVDVAGGGTSNGTNVQQWAFVGSNLNERFQITPTDNGYYRISPVIATSQCIDVSGISTADGANIHTWAYGGGNNQQWRFEDQGGGYYKIIARHSDKCLDVEGVSTADGANIHQWTCNAGAQNQAFEVIAVNSASEEIAVKNAEIFPNPAINGEFTVNITGNVNDSHTLAIYSFDGKKVFEDNSLSSGNTKINTGLAKGIYFVKIDNSNDNIHKLVIK